MPLSFKNQLTQKIVAFIDEIGINVTQGDVPDDSFLPGIVVQNGALIVDENKLLYPGDLLHEAGHLAFASADVRPTLGGEVILPDVDLGVVEVQAMCWSYAACLFIGIEPEIVFHDNGYYGRSASLLFNFRIGNYIGLPGLEAAGMAYSPQSAARLALKPFPTMFKWLSD